MYTIILVNIISHMYAFGIRISTFLVISNIHIYIMLKYFILNNLVAKTD